MLQTEGGLRERKKQQTRSALSDAAFRLATEKGPDQVTVEEIAEAAGVSVRTFFNYFPHKEYAILGRDPEQVERALDYLRTAPADESPLTVLLTIALDILRDLESGGELTRRGKLIMSSPNLLFHLMKAGIEDEQLLTAALAGRLGEPAPSLRAALLVSVTGSVGRVAVELHQADPARGVLELVQDAFQLLAQGIDPAFVAKLSDQKGHS